MDELWIIGIYHSTELTGSRLNIYGIATNPDDALIMFEEMKKVEKDDPEDSYEMISIEANKLYAYAVT